MLFAGICAAAVSAAEPAVTDLTVPEVRRRALEANRQYLSAREEVTKARADIVQARAGAFPDIRLNSYYNRNFSIAPLFFLDNGEVRELQFGFKNNFGASISLRQPIWEGGKVYTAYKIAKQYHHYAQAGERHAADATIFQAELLFYQAVLDRSRLAVVKQSLATAEQNLKTVSDLYSQGMVSKFELLRAQVERSSILPDILALESEVQLSEKRLKSYLGMDLDAPVDLIEPEDDTALAGLPPLRMLIDTALASRQEMVQAELMVEMTKRAVRVARAGYFPSLAAVSQYDWQAQADEFALDQNTGTSFTAGLTLSFPIFDGGVTRSAVGRRKAEHRQSVFNEEALKDQIRIEVEKAYDELMQAKKTLEIQAETIAQADEGLRIAQLRYEAGEGTLLEVLSAQTALAAARTSEAQARFALRSSLAGLKLASTIDVSGDKR